MKALEGELRAKFGVGADFLGLHNGKPCGKRCLLDGWSGKLLIASRGPVGRRPSVERSFAAGRVPRLFLFVQSARRRGQAILPHDGNRSRDLW